MRRLVIIALGLTIGLAAAIGYQVQQANALQAHFNKVKSDCASVEAQVTLLYSRDDEPNEEENRDYFSMIILDESLDSNYLEQVPESITDRQTPYYWNTGSVETAAFAGVYNLEMWDIDREGELQDRLESYVYDCTTGDGYWDTDEHSVPTEIPEYTCQTGVPVYTTNFAPEDGALIITWSYDGQQYEDQDWHVETVRISQGDSFDMETFPVPCFSWVKLYYQPDSTKEIYLMPSQYWPHGAYGAGGDDNGIDLNHYHTFFPLDGATKPEELDETDGTPSVDELDIEQNNP